MFAARKIAGAAMKVCSRSYRDKWSDTEMPIEALVTAVFAVGAVTVGSYVYLAAEYVHSQFAGEAKTSCPFAGGSSDNDASDS